MSRKAFAITKEELAAGRLADAVGSAQNAKVFQTPREGFVVIHGKRHRITGGRNLDADEAHRIVALVALGKKSIVFRSQRNRRPIDGAQASERAEAIQDLAHMLKRSRTSDTSTFAMNICRCIASVAMDELAIDMCEACAGAGEMPDHNLQQLEGRQPMKVCPTCMGSRRRRYNDDQRITSLAKAWISHYPAQPLDDPAAVSVVAASLRKHKQCQRMLAAIVFAKGILLEAERVATEETARMVERM
jgi:hypothetical protein